MEREPANRTIRLQLGGHVAKKNLPYLAIVGEPAAAEEQAP
jgi:hypothetical protein